MRHLDTPSLIEYIRYAIDLESAVVAHEETIKQYKLFSVENKPKLKQLQMPDAPKSSSYIQYGQKWIGIGLAGFGSLFSFAGLLTMWENESNRPVFFVGLPFIILGIPIWLHYAKLEKNEAEKQNAKMRELMRWHDERVSAIQKAYIEAKKVYEENIKEWEISDEDAMYDLNETREELKSALSKYYEGDVIYPKYRNLPALTSIYEYLTSGRCSELTGSDGAYNLYESELRQNIVISQLNTIISNLEQIRQNQYTLYQEMVKINHNTQEIRQ